MHAHIAPPLSGLEYVYDFKKIQTCTRIMLLQNEYHRSSDRTVNLCFHFYHSNNEKIHTLIASVFRFLRIILILICILMLRTQSGNKGGILGKIDAWDEKFVSLRMRG